MEISMEFILGLLIVPAIIYFIIRTAVEEGTYHALIKYDEHKKQNASDDK